MEGVLFTYHAARRLVGFQSGDVKCENILVYIGGLTDGFLAHPYLHKLNEKLKENNWSLVQVILSSSYSGYGTSSLAKDTEELDALIDYLLANRPVKNVCLLGHSTGCQDIVWYLKHGKNKHHIKKGFLQGAVSDREYMWRSVKDTEKWATVAEDFVKSGLEKELMPVSAHEVPITAYRYNSLVNVGGDDDFFSCDFSNEKLEEIFLHMRDVPCLWVFSEKDEFVPVEYAPLIPRKIEEAVGKKHKVVVMNGDDHECNKNPDLFVQEVISFLIS
eukprot:TRINITY_DN1813_c0_g1_i1.p1 TRINITY_DN1813_c0_g1~~TRINITY_DN1813_c0_g1_i1.p1  ORF type:complete len:274 (+),score=41.52 TRINITY_DN1813_c0_g1_i1:863-1684(+)